MDKITFRFDDVSINSCIDTHNKMTDFLFEKFPGCEVIWAISPTVCSSQKETGRVFPKRFNAFPKYQNFYKMDKMGIPPIHPKVSRATHGLVHVDHRLLTKEAQELSIVLSSHLTESGVFVPPFNMFDKNTEAVCKENNIRLIKFEDGWESMEHNGFGKYCNKNYLHAREWTFEAFKNWFEE